MAKTPIQDRPPLAQWLIRSREQLDLTAEAFLAELRAEGGRTPHRSNYAQWESGKVTPEPASLQPLVDFYAARGIGGPAEHRPAADQPAPDLATALLALAESNRAMAAELAALREERRESAARLEAMERAIQQLAGRVAAAADATSAAPPARRASAGSDQGR